MKKFSEHSLILSTGITKCARSLFEPKLLERPQVVWKNYEMSYDADSHEPLIRYPTTTVLQEYFIPPKKLTVFLKGFWKIIKAHDVNLLNVSLRYVKASKIALLNYAPEDRIAIVLYLNVVNNNKYLTATKLWTQMLINLSLKFKGSFYLPYLLFASIEQFRECYPTHATYNKIKKKYDLYGRFSNQFLERYLYV